VSDRRLAGRTSFPRSRVRVAFDARYQVALITVAYTAGPQFCGGQGDAHHVAVVVCPAPIGA